MIGRVQLTQSQRVPTITCGSMRVRMLPPTDPALIAPIWQEVEHPTEGPLLQVSTPLTFDGERLPLGAPAPRLGADTDAVLDELT